MAKESLKIPVEWLDQDSTDFILSLEHDWQHDIWTAQSIQDFFRYFRITIPTKNKQCPEWRLTPRILGQIQGLPQSYGILCATNGIMCYIDQAASRDILPYCGHIQSFLPDDKEVDMWEVRTGKQRPAATRISSFSLPSIEQLGY